MIYPDTSFLCALYRDQGENSEKAAAYMQQRTDPLIVTAAVIFEFKQSMRLHQFIHANDASSGVTEKIVSDSFCNLQSDLETGIIKTVAVDWPDIWSIAERLSVRYTVQDGNRTVDIIHVAAALHLGAREFLTFDAKQAALAKNEGLVLGL